MRLSAIITSTLLATGLSVSAPAFAADFAGGPSVSSTTVSKPQIITADLSIPLNKTKVIRLDQVASAVIIGNPEIADVSVHSGNTLFVVGRGYGNTNLVILNAAGQTVLDADVNVTQSISAQNVRLFKGTQDNRRTYHCAPYCAASPVLGDDPGFLAQNTPPANPITNNTAAGALTDLETQIGLARELGLASTGPFIPPTEPDVQVQPRPNRNSLRQEF